MSLQKAVATEYSVGIPGDKASLNEVIYTTINPIAENDVQAGTFVWAGDTEATAKYDSDSSAAPIGFVQRNISYPDASITSDGTMTIPQGHALTVARKGDFWATADSAITIGTQIKADPANGKIKQTGGVNTGWYAKTASAANGDLILISSW